MLDQSRLPACHPPLSFVWRPSRAEPLRAYSCASWFVPDQVDWQGKDFQEASDYAAHVNRILGFNAPRQPLQQPDRRWSLSRIVDFMRRLGAPRLPIARATAPTRQLPRHSSTPLRRPSPIALVSMLRQFHRHNAAPIPELFAYEWAAQDRLTTAGHYAMSRALLEAPQPFLRCMFIDIPEAMEKYGAVLRVASLTLQNEPPPQVALSAAESVEAESLPPLERLSRLRQRLTIKPALLCAAG
jgi:hypothetical protein